MEFLADAVEKLPPILHIPIVKVDTFLQAFGFPHGSGLLVCLIGSFMLVIILQSLIGFPSTANTAGGDKGKHDSARNRTVLFTGISNTGKTAALYKLLFNDVPVTTTSMHESQVECALSSTNGKTYRFVDHPGHSRLRDGIFRYIPELARLIVFVEADSSMEKLRETAELLYDIFTDPKFSEMNVPTLIVASKSDKGNARDAQTMKETLEAQLNSIKDSRRVLAQTNDVTNGQDTELNERVYLCPTDTQFQFDQHSPCDVSFLSMDLDHIDALSTFIGKGSLS